MKLAIVINGAGGVGKDTLCGFAASKYKTVNVSSVDLIKKAAEILGWDKRKDLASRKFLSDMKKLSSEYNDGPTSYLLDQYRLFQNSDAEIMFMHIREGSEIKHLIEKTGPDVISLLIRRSSNKTVYGNASDDNIENYNYDYIYNNDFSLEEAETDFTAFLENIINERNL